MIHRTLKLLLPMLVLGMAATAAPAQADGNLELGFEDGQVTLAPGADSPGILSRWNNELGVEIVRVQAYWSAIAPSPRSRTRPAGFNPANHADPLYNWASLDNAINLVRGAGLRVMLTVHQFGPRWASTQPSRNRLGWKPSPSAYAAFARAAATRYRNSVDRYLAGNEPNEGVFLAPQTECRRAGRRFVCERVAPSIYRNLVNAAYPAIKSADPGAQVIIGELAPIGGIGPRSGNLAPLAFVRAMWCRDDRYRRVRSGLCAIFRSPRGDGFGYHPYQIRARPNQHNPNPNSPKLGDLPAFFRVLDRVAGRRFNMYITEYGYETRPPDFRFGVSPSTQSRYLQQSAYIMWRNPRVKLMTQYLWRDDRAIRAFQTGLHFANGVAKPSLATFPHPFFIDVPRNRRAASRIWGQVRPGGGTQVRVFQQLGGSGAFRQFLTLNTTGKGYFIAVRALPRNSNYYFEYTLNGTTRRSDTVHVS